jgi:hypothetical protein
MVVRTAPRGPVKQPIVCRDREIVNAGMPDCHQAIGVELPVFVAIGAKPLAAFVLRFVSKAHRDTVSGESPKLLDEPIVAFALPLAREKRDNLFTAMDELITVEGRGYSKRPLPCELSR